MSGIARHRVALLGGLGNQLFQLAFGRQLARAGGAVDFDRPFGTVPTLSLLLGNELKLTRYGWLRGLGPVGRFSVIGNGIRRASGFPRTVIDLSLEGAAGRRAPGGNAYWFGYWQDPEYVDNETAAEVESGLVRACREARPTGASDLFTVAVHVRRGDYLGVAPVLTPSYYRSALEAVIAAAGVARSDVRVITVSDDPSWVLRHLAFAGVGEQVVQSHSATDDLASLASSDACVLSNSTFSWWGGRLRVNRPIAAPLPWALGGADDAGSGLRLRDWIEVPARYYIGAAARGALSPDAGRQA